MTCKEIKEIIDIFYNLDISIQCRERLYVDYRFIYCYMCKKYAKKNITLKIIGKAINRDHSSVIYGLKQYVKLHETCAVFRRKVVNIEKLIKEKYEAEQHRRIYRNKRFRAKRNSLQNNINNIIQARQSYLQRYSRQV